MHFPVACLHSLAEVLCVSEARAGAESLMDGVQGSRTSAVVGRIAARRNHTRSPWVCTALFVVFFVTVGATGKQRELEGEIYKEETQEGLDARGWQGCEGVQRAGGSEPP